MNTQVTTAIILAAGMGTRLRETGASLPKGFIRIGGERLIERSIRLLRAAGIKSIYIGTGYGADRYEGLKSRYPFITTVHNPEFAVSGSLFTFFQFRELLSEPVLLLESDLLFEPRAVTSLSDTAAANAILASGFTQSGDEVFIQRSASGMLENMSKNKSELIHCDCELVGITRIRPDLFQAMMNWAGQEFEAGRRQRHYEEALVQVARSLPVPVKVVDDLVWCEIDDASHMKRAMEVVYPKIQRMS
jgi:2-aminoethylphosphonate-pyruvate transaminase